MNKRWFPMACMCAVALLVSASAFAEPLPVKTIDFSSKSVGRKLKYNIVLPDKYEETKKRYPVLYLLHGYSSNYTAWARMGVPEYARRYELIVVMADGGNSWYVNWSTSEQGQMNRWEDCIVKDLIEHVDATFRTVAQREGRAINGLSMGGYGALVLGLRHPDLFCSIGSHSGAIAFAKEFGERLKSGQETQRARRPPSTTPDPRIGIEGFNSQAERTLSGKVFSTPEDCAAYDPFQLVLRISPEKMPHIYVDCGTGDRLLKSAEDFARLLMERKVPFVYGQSGGGHERAYWTREVGVSMAVQYAVMERNLAAVATTRAR